MRMGRRSKAGMLVLIGNPVEHSASPTMFNTLFLRTGMWGLCYFALRLEGRAK